MKTLIVVPLACVALVAGCASSDKMRQVESTSETNQKLLRETDQRLRTLEQSVNTLDSQVAQLNNRVYEVRTRGGQKTGMTVVPIIPPQPHKSAVVAPAQPESAQLSAHGPVAASSERLQSQPATNAASANSATPNARAIDPAATIRPIPAAAPRETARAEAEAMPKTPAAKTAAQQSPAEKPQAAAKGAAGSAAGGSAASFALPPESALPPAASAASGKGAVQPMLPPVAAAGGNPDVPVPSVPVSDLALPPEHPGLGLPPLPGDAAAKNGAKGKAAKAAASPAPASAPASAASVAATPAVSAQTQPAALPKSGKGEEAAYKAALQPAMSGRAADSIGRFQTFLQEYPQGRFAANAEYWIGEGYYAQGKYKDALAQFEKVNSQWPRHHKNADALLKTGMTLSRMGDKEGAAQAYKKLLSQFPNSEAAGLARSRGLAR
ncbi:tol-pal system protein YbgF [Desulfovibrio desulfuricans]|uniref:tol-pal system protein YbgF n=1 Tax=Desulfovibrio desulfuricans TaxID=876 RepID=UPI001AE620CA|nr:tol-pal system protein YbgF [Desulfovibrio desulfuricans]MDD3683256.1 tol-pal system protein YbgF [Desulfovibrio desulfuricans]QTO39337.1 tol-pal system protein YbgF [Desulfovibrio desulfuricans]